jgi:hypothetical protein
MRKYLFVEIKNKKSGKTVACQICVSQKEVDEIVVFPDYEMFVVKLDKKSALKGLKTVRYCVDLANSLLNNLK